MYGYCGRWPENALVQLLEWLGPSKEARSEGCRRLGSTTACDLALIRGQGYVVYSTLLRATILQGTAVELLDYV